MLRPKQPITENTSFQLGVRLRQLVSKFRLQKKPEAFPSTTAKPRFYNPDSCASSPSDKDFLSLFCLVSLRVKIDPLKNMHIKLEKYLPLRVRYLIS